MKEPGYEVLWPRGSRTVENVPYARRLDTLDGKTIGELSNRVFHADEFFPLIEKELTKRYPGIKFVNYKVLGNIHGRGDEEAKVIAALPDNLKKHKCDAVISGVGC